MYSIVSTVLVSLVLIAIVTLVLVKMSRDKKKGKRSCGMACSGCPGAATCFGRHGSENYLP